jgi:hypothetical protein
MNQDNDSNGLEVFDLRQTVEALSGPSKEHIIVHNQWAATAFDRYHKDSRVEIEFLLHGEARKGILSWDSNFPKNTMKEDKDIANHGGVAMAWFVMSVLLKYAYVEQTEIGDGVDYRFLQSEPNDDDLNFLNDYHYVEISGILEQTASNTLVRRLKEKHIQIQKGQKRDQSSSVIVTVFDKPVTVKELHK